MTSRGFKNKVGAIIQARIDSSRLNRKIFTNLDGKPVLEHVINKLKKSSYIDEIIVATSNDFKDYEIIEWCKVKNIKYFNGEKEDVLSRFYHCALKYKIDTIVRVTSDNPLLDIIIVDEVIKLFNKDFDYAANNIKKTFPHGLDVEVFNFGSLKKSFTDTNIASHREHVTQYIRHNPKKFKISNLEAKENNHHIRVTLDTIEDYKLLNEVVKIGGINIGLEQLLKIFRQNKFLKDINRQSRDAHSIYNTENNII